MAIHPTALIDPSAQLAPDVQVGAYTVIGANVVIGAGTWIGPHVVVDGPTTIGSDNKIFQFASIGAAPQDLKYNNEPTRLEIGDRNTFRENVTVNRGTTKDQLVTKIGSDNLFMTGSHVGHDCVIGSHCVLANYATLGGHVIIGDWVHMGGFAGIHQFCQVGAHAFIANNTAVTRDVPPFVMAVGRPAEPHSVNSEGLKRRGYSAEQIRNIRDAYRILYRSQLKLIEATEQIEQRGKDQPELQLLIDFLNDSTPRRERVGIVR
ncbi:acyl-ACP--UDP-N-acetylglucosamine O-acyltransferase [Steroidobacter sp.]|uniref:acyl-ACP--UDP-N-acetylglucosamine O-acyltransferase n=1 Tax=Steroidobacter sp. TaxID=1978227 RepID=UPI001A4E0518|nr:acyl-ACP--UDP-N-acetylglucosamine O-acyltransferase [Steroidobacter sp.]MBL8271960.1 acyl-ACP--UDP-N-acetylglucosamine O-acyltransferase [Steroidobacter sp.]